MFGRPPRSKLADGLAQSRKNERSRRRQRTNLKFEPLENRQLLATRIWDGGGSDNLWTTAANWSTDVAPVANDDLTFPTSGVRYSPVNDFIATTFGTITFGDYGYNVTGNPISLTGGITSTYTGVVSSSLDTDITLLSNIAVSVSGGGLGLGGAISDGADAFGLTKTGAGSLGLNGANTYDGTTTISAGAISISNDQALGSTDGNTVINGGSLYVLGGSPRTVAENLSLTGGGSGASVLVGINGDSTLTGNITIASHPGINALNGTTLTLSGVIDDSSGTSALTLSSDSTSKVVVGGTNLYDGVTNISTGLVNITAAGSLGDVATSNTTTVATGASLEISGGITLPSTKSIRLNGTPMSGLMKLISSSGDNTIAGGVRLGNSATVDVVADSLTFSGVISQDDPFNLTKYGIGLLTLGAVNTYTGTTTINAGTLLLNGTVAGPVAVADGKLAGSGTISGAGINTSGTASIEPGPIGGEGILTYSGSSGVTLASDTTLTIDLNGTTVGTGYDQIALTSGSALFNPNGAILDIHLGFIPAVNQSFQIVSQAYSSAITGRFNGISQFGSITVGVATFSVGYFSSGIILTVTAVTMPTFTWDGGDADDSLWSSPDNWLGDVAPTAGANLTFPAGASRLANVNDFSAGSGFHSITIAGAGYSIHGNSIGLDGGITTSYASGNSTFAIETTLLANLTFDLGSGGTLSIDSDLGDGAGAFGFTKSGAGTLVLSGTNTFDGDVTVQGGGAVQVESDQALGSALGITTIEFANAVHFAGSDLNVLESFIISGSGIGDSGALSARSGSAILYGTVDLSAGAAVGALSDATLTFNGVIDDSIGTFIFDFANGPTGRTVLGGTNLFDGSSSSVLGGFLRLTNDDALGLATAPRTIYLDSGASLELADGVTIPSNKALTISGLPVSNFSKIINVSGDNTYAGDIGITGGNNESTDVASGTTLTLSGEISGSRDMDKNGPGTLVLSGTSTHTGNWNVGDGFLLVTGDISSSNQVFVDGTLGGTGIVPDVVLSGIGTLAPGMSPGILQSAGLTFQDGSNYSVQVNGTTAGTGYDQVDATGSVTLGGSLSLSIGFSPAMGDAFTIINNDGSDLVSGTFNGLAEGASIVIGHATFNISYSGGTGNDVVLTVADVTYIWDGGDADDSLWSSPDNWVGDVAPTAGANLVFPVGAMRFSNVNDFAAGFDVHSVTLAAAGYSIFGNAIDLIGGINTDYSSGLSMFSIDTDLVGSSSFDVATGGRMVLGGVLFGSGILVKDGGGTLQLDGTNSYLGGTTVNAGTLAITKSEALGSGTATIGDGSMTSGHLEINLTGPSIVSNTFVFNTPVVAGLKINSGTTTFNGGTTLNEDLVVDIASGASLQFAGPISDVGLIRSLTKDGTGTLIYSGANTYTGTTFVNQGLLQLNSGTASILGSLAIGGLGTTATVQELQGNQIANGSAVSLSNPNATLNLNGFSDTIGSLALIGSTVTTGAGILTIASGGCITTVASSVTATLSGHLAFGGPNNLLSVAQGTTPSGIDLAISAVVSSGMNIIKDGAGTMALSGANTYSGGTNINAGVLAISHNSGAGSGVVNILGTGTLQLSGGVTASNSINVDSSTTAIRNSAGTNTLSGMFNLGIDATIDTAQSSRLVIASTVNDSGNAFGLTKTGAGTLVLNGANTYDGTTTILSGTIVAKNELALGSTAGGTIVADGATLLFQIGGDTVAEPITLGSNGGSATLASDTGNLVLTGNITLLATGNIVTDGESLELSGVIDDAHAGFGLSKSGSGTLFKLSGDNTFDGDIHVNAGELEVLSLSALGSTLGSTTVAGNGAILFDFHGGTLAETFHLGSSGNGVFLRNLSGETTLSGPIALEGINQFFNGVEPLSISGVISGSGGIRTVGNRLVYLSGANTYLGATQVNNGTLIATSAGALSTSAVTINTGATLAIQGGHTITPSSITMGGLGVSSGGALQSLDGVNAYNGPITLTSNTNLAVNTGSMTLSGSLGGSYAASILGAGTLVLSGTNTIGGLSVQQGTTLINGTSTLPTNGAEVNVGATLGGSGTVGNVLIKSGATIAPGNSPGILNVGNVTFLPISTYAVQINGTAVGTQYDQLDANGTVNLGGSTLSLSLGMIPTVGDTYTIINNDAVDAVIGTFDGLPEGTVFAYQGQPFKISYVGGTGNDVVLTSVAIAAEPTTLTNPTVGSVYSQQITAVGGSGTGYLFTATGLPAGLSISPGGLISGTPTTAISDPVEVAVTIVDSLGTTTTTIYFVAVNPAISVAPGTLSTSTVGSSYSEQLTATGGSGTGYTFSATGLPAGLSISLSGLITGTPTSTLTASVLVTITDGDGATTVKPYDVTPGIAATATSLSTSPDPSLYGQVVTLTATLTSGATGIGLPTGTVQFFHGTTLLGTASLNNQGVATLTKTPLLTGSSTVTAVYLGDANYGTSTSTPTTQTVSQAGSSSSLTASTTTPSLNQPVTFQATITGQFGGAVSGTVSFFDGTTLLGSATINDQGIATFLTSSLGLGIHSITAVFNGDSNFFGSTSPAVTITPSETIAGSVTSSDSQVFYGQDVTLTATFSATSNRGASMTGTVMFYDGTTFLGTATLNSTTSGTVASASIGGLHGSIGILVDTTSGQAQFATTGLTVGNHIIRAVYSGDANYSPATSETPVSVNVALATTVTTLTANPTSTGTILTATVAVTSPGNPPIVGNVTFFDGTTRLATVPVVDGMASYDAGVLPPGMHSFSAVYSSDGGTSSGSGSTAQVSTDGPKVIGLSRYGFHNRPTSLVLNFDMVLDASRAANVANYRILDGAGRRIAVTKAVYNPTNFTVTLTTARSLSLYKVFTLTVAGTEPSGLTGATGIPLNGSGANQSGSNFTSKLTWKTLAVPGSTPAITFSNGQTISYHGNMQRYLNAIVRATKALAYHTLRSPAQGKPGR
ncbi:Ig-like domain repeat protein [Isosphaeraceae bacterium EP7]